MNTESAINSHKLTLRISFLVAIIGLIVVAAAITRIANSYTKTATVEISWQDSKQAAELGALSMYALQEAVGYGGLIHNFKNYVLRQDESYLENFLRDYADLERITERYLSQPYVSAAEISAYKTVLSTMRQYRVNITTAEQLANSGASPAIIDEAIRIDDSKALEAIHIISLEWERRQQAFRADFNRFFRYLQTQNQYGIVFISLLSLTVIGAVISTFGLRRVIGQAVQENLRRQQAENDLTRRSLELERSNQDLRQFAYVASHDLRSPLRAIGNLADWIEEDLEDKLEGETQEHMQMMKKRIARLDRLLNDLLEYSRASNKTLQAESTNLNEVVKDVTELLLAGDSETLKTAGDLPTIDAPKAVMATAIRNLVNNALKHHDKEQKQLLVQTSESNDNYYIHVIDDGPGIPAKFHNKIFQMFTTLQSRDETEGSGMGLALVSRQLQNYGGSLSVNSPVHNERGTEFIIQWPKQPQYEH